jgi:hypothetical protein
MTLSGLRPAALREFPGKDGNPGGPEACLDDLNKFADLKSGRPRYP